MDWPIFSYLFLLEWLLQIVVCAPSLPPLKLEFMYRVHCWGRGCKIRFLAYSWYGGDYAEAASSWRCSNRVEEFLATWASTWFGGEPNGGDRVQFAGWLAELMRVYAN
jgi:hypothetical protein